MPTLRTIVFAVLGLGGLAHGIHAERVTRESARKEAIAWDEVRKLEHQLLGVRLEVQDCERRLYLTEKDVNEKLGFLATQRCKLLPGTCCSG
jgi:hypothetical protein